MEQPQSVTGKAKILAVPFMDIADQEPVTVHASVALIIHQEPQRVNKTHYINERDIA